jgi:isocitrate dehydrogenase
MLNWPHFAAGQIAGRNEAKIVEELNSVQGRAQDIGGYYYPDPAKTAAVMRPSTTFNTVLESV